MKIEKSFVFKKIPQHLAETFGKEKATAIMQYANTEFQALEASEPDADKTSRSFVFPAVAIYRAVEHFIPGKALEVTDPMGQRPVSGCRSCFEG